MTKHTAYGQLLCEDGHAPAEHKADEVYQSIIRYINARHGIPIDHLRVYWVDAPTVREDGIYTADSNGRMFAMYQDYET